MEESVAKQLRFSPVASTPLEQQQFHLHTVQRRLDARPDWGDGSSNPTGGPALITGGAACKGRQLLTRCCTCVLVSEFSW